MLVRSKSLFGGGKIILNDLGMMHAARFDCALEWRGASPSPLGKAHEVIFLINR
jgi:hypothetical protein